MDDPENARAVFAAMAMSALISTPETYRMSTREIAERSVEFADALVLALDGTTVDVVSND